MLRFWPLLLLSVILKTSSASPLYSAHAHNRTSRHQDCYEDEYRYKGRCCRNCPAGTRVSAHCTENHHRGACEACTAGEDFTAAPSGLESCLSCLICKTDKVLVQECTSKTDAVCECKPGYYCIPDEPCEICNRCSRCREGQRVKKLCTSTTDTVCEDVSTPEPTSTKADVKGGETVPAPIDSFDDVSRSKTVPTDPTSDPAGSKSDIILSVAIPIAMLVFFLIIIITSVRLYRNRKEKEKAKDNIENSLIDTTQNNSENASLRSVQSEGEDPKEQELPPEQRPLMPPDPTKVETLINQMAVSCVVKFQSEPEEDNVAEPVEDEEDCEESSQLGEPCNDCGRPQPCDQQWGKFYYIVYRNIGRDNMLELVRTLHLDEATIEEIINNNNNSCREQNYKLLSEWRLQKGTRATMTAVLNELKDMNLGGCCENIVNTMRSKKIPMN